MDQINCIRDRAATRSIRVLLVGTLLLLPACSENPSDSGNGDAIYSVAVDEPVRVLEGTDLVFTVTRRVDPSNQSTVSFTLTGEATYGEDYSELENLRVAFAPGQTSAEIRLEALRDEETEEEESVVVTLTTASDGTVDPDAREATGYIRDGGPSCAGPQGTALFVDFDDISTEHSAGAGSGTRLTDGYHGFIWGDWWARDDVVRDQFHEVEPGSWWYDGIVSNPNAIYPSFGAQPGSISVITRNEPFVLKSFYMSALGTREPLPVTLRYRSRDGHVFGEETFVVSYGEKKFIEPDTDIMYAHCLGTISFNQPVLGASFIIDDMTFIH